MEITGVLTISNQPEVAPPTPAPPRGGEKGNVHHAADQTRHQAAGQTAQQDRGNVWQQGAREVPGGAAAAIRQDSAVTLSDRLAQRAVQAEEGAGVLLRDSEEGREARAQEETERRLFELRAAFVVDDYNNVVIQFIDEEGEVVRQIPPEEFIKMAERMRENIENLFHKEV
ncbi:flagellar protein FlaG [Thermodesulfovibrionales bacterium]|nr:flagellar protein FlaG [Thermodesulfovibrionales bacterium]